jgi:hypothetical protein
MRLCNDNSNKNTSVHQKSLLASLENGGETAEVQQDSEVQEPLKSKNCCALL